MNKEPSLSSRVKGGWHIASAVPLRQCKYLNNIIEQDRRVVKKRTWLAKGYRSFQSAWRTLEGIETMSMIRSKGRVRWMAKKNVAAKARIVANLFGIVA